MRIDQLLGMALVLWAMLVASPSSLGSVVVTSEAAIPSREQLPETTADAGLQKTHRRAFETADDESELVKEGSTVIAIKFVLKPEMEGETLAIAAGMGIGVVVFVIYLLCTRYCFQDVGSERSKKWFKVPSHTTGHPDQLHGGFGGPGSLQGSASHLNGLGTLTGGDPAAEYQLRVLLNSMMTGSPRSQAGGGTAGSPVGADLNNNNSFNARAVRSESFMGSTTGAAAAAPPPRTAVNSAAVSATTSAGVAAAAPPAEQYAVNSTAPPLDGSPPMAPPR
jgi:hypothetical protein